VDESKVQPRYKVELWLEARDTDLGEAPGKEEGPGHVSPSGEKFTFIVVSEAELLTEIAKEEELKYVDLDEMLGKVLEAQNKLVQADVDLSGGIKADNLVALSARCEQITEVLEKSQQKAKDVYIAYERILREMRTNVVQDELSKKIAVHIVRPLGHIEGVEFDRTRDAVVAFRKALDNADLAPDARVAAARKAGDAAKVRMRSLTDQIGKVLAAMQGVTDLNKLIKVLRDIEDTEQKQYEITLRLYKKRFEESFPADDDDDKPLKKPGGR